MYRFRCWIKTEKKNLFSLCNKNNISLWWGKKGLISQVWVTSVSKEEHVSFQNSTAAAALVWDVSGPVLLWCSSAVGCPTEAFLQKSPFCFTAWDFSTAELFMKLNYFSYLSWGNTLRGFLKVNPAFITSCSLLDNLGIILLLISPVEMKLLWIGMGLVEADSNCRFFSTPGKEASLQSPQIPFE